MKTIRKRIEYRHDLKKLSTHIKSLRDAFEALQRQMTDSRLTIDHLEDVVSELGKADVREEIMVTEETKTEWGKYLESPWLYVMIAGFLLVTFGLLLHFFKSPYN